METPIYLLHAGLLHAGPLRAGASRDALLSRSSARPLRSLRTWMRPT